MSTFKGMKIGDPTFQSMGSRKQQSYTTSTPVPGLGIGRADECLKISITLYAAYDAVINSYEGRPQIESTVSYSINYDSKIVRGSCKEEDSFYPKVLLNSNSPTGWGTQGTLVFCAPAVLTIPMDDVLQHLRNFNTPFPSDSAFFTNYDFIVNDAKSSVIFDSEVGSAITCANKNSWIVNPKKALHQPPGFNPLTNRDHLPDTVLFQILRDSQAPATSKHNSIFNYCDSFNRAFIQGPGGTISTEPDERKLVWKGGPKKFEEAMQKIFGGWSIWTIQILLRGIVHGKSCP